MKRAMCLPTVALGVACRAMTCLARHAARSNWAASDRVSHTLARRGFLRQHDRRRARSIDPPAVMVDRRAQIFKLAPRCGFGHESRRLPVFSGLADFHGLPTRHAT